MKYEVPCSLLRAQVTSLLNYTCLISTPLCLLADLPHVLTVCLFGHDQWELMDDQWSQVTPFVAQHDYMKSGELNESAAQWYFNTTGQNEAITCILT
jgi:hypothetical protein